MKQSRATLQHFPLVLSLPRAHGLRVASAVAFTKEQQAVATIPGIPNARVWSDDRADTLLARAKSEVLADAAGRAGAINVLAISGGGSNGAYGAGLLTGWSDRGTRPEFTVVTGASAGALIAPFAFLGSAYDPCLKSCSPKGSARSCSRSTGSRPFSAPACSRPSRSSG